jgi:Holliday junction resolvasome RuvABC endonuclease subunit
VTKIVRVVGIDPALANMGIARMQLDIDTMVLGLDGIQLVTTEKRTSKQVRQNSDDLRRARELHDAFHAALEGCVVAFAEIPQGSQHARSAFAFGVAIGVLASCRIPLIEVQPLETKLASVGHKTATKPEIINWAEKKYPSAPWLRYKKDSKLKGKVRQKGDLHDDNEHTADACAIAHAGIRLREFTNLISMWKSTEPAMENL